MKISTNTASDGKGHKIISSFKTINVE